MPDITISFASQSLPGGKPENEDACGIEVPADASLSTKGIAAAIADGMSGSDAGKEASVGCVRGFLNDYFSTPDSWTVKTSVQKVLTALNTWLHGNGQRLYDSHKGMVTTLSALVIKSNTAYIFHIGDTRIYHWRHGELRQLTHDHRVQINTERSLLSRAMGIDIHLDIDYRQLPVEIGDIFVMLTDGVHEFVTDARIKSLLEAHLDSPQAAVDAIVQLAIDNKTNDNVTCQILRIDKLPGANKEEFFQRLTELPFPPPLDPGMILDGYKILRHMFSNKRTEVYLAQDTEKLKTVILKAPSINYDDDAEYINRFLHEEWVGRRIKNPHVMKVLPIIRNRTALYYIAEYIQGRTLRQWMHDEAKPSISVLRTMIEQIACGLRAFHRLEMIHQDLKPENILVDEHGTLKIIDFGSTKIAGIDEISTPIQENNLLGTINYTAPEYHTDTAGSNRSDIFSLGVIAYELLTGQLPYGKELTARNIHKVRYRPVRELNPEVPYWVDKAIEKAVQINPQYRFSHLSEFIHALSKPDPQLAKAEFVPLIKRDPVTVWRTLAMLSLLANLLLLYLLFA